MSAGDTLFAPVDYPTYRREMGKIISAVERAAAEIPWRDDDWRDASELAAAGVGEAVVYIALCKAADDFAAEHWRIIP